MRSTCALPLILSLCWCSVVACGGDDGGSSTGEETATDNVPQDPHEVACTDESVTKLTLFDQEPSDAEVINDAQDEGFLTEVDTTGGALSPTESFVYLKFTDDGLELVEVNDEDAFESVDWDIAARRFVLRLNSGVSGPGWVKAGRTAPQTKFESVDEVPDDLELRVEEYFSEDCTFLADAGIGSATTVLSSFWSYMACVEMTHNVYIIEVDRPKKRHVKLEVMGYYPADRQQICDDTGMVPTPSGAGQMTLRWAFID
jgi:hypothetical protein